MARCSDRGGSVTFSRPANWSGKLIEDQTHTMLAKATKAWEGGFPLRPWREENCS
jgi:hypothetical protein